MKPRKVKDSHPCHRAAKRGPEPNSPDFLNLVLFHYNMLHLPKYLNYI